MDFLSYSETETFDFGRSFARQLGAGDVVLFFGELGAGKTALIRGICAGFEVPEDEVHSPTFAIVNEYAGAKVNVVHFDCYRIDSSSWEADGFDEYISEKKVTLIEWADNISEINYAWKICITGSGSDPRKIRVEQHPN